MYDLKRRRKDDTAQAATDIRASAQLVTDVKHEQHDPCFAIPLRIDENLVDSQDHPGYLGTLGTFWLLHYERAGELAKLEMAIEYLVHAANLTPESHPDKPGRLNKLGIAWFHRFERLGDMSDLDNALVCQVHAVNLTPDDHPNKPSGLRSLGSTWICRFERLGDMSDLDNALACQVQVVNLTPDSHPDKPRRLNSLRISWNRRFERLGDMSDLDNALACQVHAVNLTPDGHPDKPSYLNSLGSAWLHRFERLGDMADLDNALACRVHAVDLTPDSHPGMARHLNNLGNTWLCRFERLGDLSDLDSALACQVRAVNLTADDHPNKPSGLRNLGDACLCRFERLGHMTDLDNALACQVQVVNLTLDSHPDKPRRLNSLGISWNRRFERLGDMSDLDNALACQVHAVDLTPDGHPDKPSYLNSLGSAWFHRFERQGNMADLDNALACRVHAVDLTPDSHPGMARHLNNLGNTWLCRFERLGDLSDLDNALACQVHAVSITPDGHPDMASRLNSLGISWSCRFERLGNISDLDNALACQVRAVNLTPDGHPDKPSHLRNLGNAWSGRFDRLGDMNDLDNALACQVHAINITPEVHPDKSSHLNNLGITWLRRFERLGDMSNLDNVLTCQAQAVDLAAEGHPAQSIYLYNLGNSHWRRYVISKDSQDLETASVVFGQGARSLVGQPRIQFNCARRWAGALSLLKLSPLDAYRTAFALLPKLIWLGQTAQARYSTLTTISKFVPDAAAWAFSTNLHDFALEWLEQGCSVIWKQTLQLRTPLDDLAEVSAELANNLKDTASQLDAMSSASYTVKLTPETMVKTESLTQRRHRLATRWENLVAEARQLPGFQEFLLPTKAQILRKAAQDGPVVLINTHDTRCDALIIMPGVEDMVHMPLPGFSSAKCEHLLMQSSTLYRNGERDHLARGFTRKSKDPLQILTSLWSDVVGPVLDAILGINKGTSDVLPHVTWCATGALSLLPLHAAGPYNGRSPNAFDLVVSSYIPMIGVLLLPTTPLIQPRCRLLAVGQAASPGQPPLPQVATELNIIKKHIEPSNYCELTGASATIQCTLEAMEKNDWVHFACHGSQDAWNPHQSAFYLHDGKLTLDEIAKRAFKNKGLAFLSACQTAAGDAKLPGESTHLAAGMLTAGYRSVIATLWSIKDEDAPRIAEGVYAELTKAGRMDHMQTARALHKAVGALRKTVGAEAIGRWAPFIHMGL